jgi:hypothetical protein
MLQKDTIKLDFAVTKGSPKIMFRRSCLEVSEETCDDIDPSMTLWPTTTTATSPTSITDRTPPYTTMMVTPPIHTDTCKLTTQGLQGNFSSKSDAQPGDQCQYCICADQPSKYLMLVIDQVPDQDCLAPVTLAWGNCSENRNPTWTSCCLTSTPYLANVESNCACIHFAAPKNGTIGFAGRFAAYGKQKQTDRQTDRTGQTDGNT